MTESEEKIKRWTEIKNTYPDDHGQVKKIEEQIEREKKKNERKTNSV